MSDPERTPTRFARALAFYVDGGFVLFLCVLGLANALRARFALAGDVYGDVEFFVRAQGNVALGLALAVLGLELAQGFGPSRRAGSFGFALCGLETVGAQPRASMRRVARVAPFIVGSVVVGIVYRTHAATIPTAMKVDLALVVFLGVTTASCILTALDAAIVLFDPSRNTLGDLIAKTRVERAPSTSPGVAAALETCSWSWLACAVFLLCAEVEARGSPDFGFGLRATVLLPIANAAWMLAVVATAAAGFSVHRVTHAALGESPRKGAVVTIAVGAPVVSFFVTRRFVRGLLDGLDVPHVRAMRIRSTIEFGTLGRSVAWFLTALPAYRIARGESDVVYAVGVLESTGAGQGDATALAHGVTALVLGFAFRSLASLDYTPLLAAPEKRDVAEVFA